jgi:hypothetical protein
MGTLGAVRSMRAVADTQAVVLPTLSALRNCTIVLPSAETVTVAPAAAADQVEPPSVDVR